MRFLSVEVAHYFPDFFESHRAPSPSFRLIDLP
jgi:hypothetical protein